MSCLPAFRLCVVQGDTMSIPMTLSSVNPSTNTDEPVDLTGATVEFSIGMHPDNNPIYVFNDGPEVTFPDAAAGEVLITIPASVTSALVAESAGTVNAPKAEQAYWHQARVLFGDGVVETFLRGELQVLQAVNP